MYKRQVSKQVHFVEIDCNGNKRNAGYAPYLDYRSLKEEEKEKAGDILEQASWLKNNIENMAIEYAITELVPRHFEEVKKRKVELVEKTMAAVTVSYTHLPISCPCHYFLLYKPSPQVPLISQFLPQVPQWYAQL